VTGIQFAGTENYQVDYEEDSSSTYCKDDVYFAKQDDADAPLDTSRVKSYLRTISNLDPTDYVTYNAEDKDLKTYGMDNPKLTVTVQYTPEKEEEDEYDGTFVLNIGRVSEKEDADGYVRVGESKIIYRISSDDYDKLTDVSYDSLRHLEVLSADFDDIHQIDVTLDGTDYTITSKGKSGDRTYSYQGEELEIDDLKNALEALSADSFTDEQPTEKEEISLTVYLDNDNYPEVQIQLYRYDGSSCLAVVDGKPVSLVKRSDVVALIEAINAIVL
jgi:hypothetical protein